MVLSFFNKVLSKSVTIILMSGRLVMGGCLSGGWNF